MDHVYLSIAILGTLTACILARAIWLKLTRERTPETQDDFTASQRRWGYLCDRRNGE